MSFEHTKMKRLERINGFFQQQTLNQSVFINVLPYCNGLLMQSVLGLFVPIHQQLSDANSENDHERISGDVLLSHGELRFTHQKAIQMQSVKQMVLVMDPYDWVIQRARTIMAPGSGVLDLYQEPRITTQGLLNAMITGLGDLPSLFDVYAHHTVAWVTLGAMLVKTEEFNECVNHVHEHDAKNYMEALCQHMLIRTPPDWRDRVLVGLDLYYDSAESNWHSHMDTAIPSTLPREQRQLVDLMAPGLRAELGYQ